MIRRLVPALVVAGLLVVGCGSSSPSAAHAGGGSPSATTPPTATPRATTPPSPAGATGQPGLLNPATATAAPSASPAPTPTPRFELTSSAFRASGAIPARFTCAGADESPPLAWTGVPVGTKRLVLIVDDPDAGHFTHWIAFSIAPASASLAEGVGTATSSLVQGTNDFGRVGYGGPCPPSGTHRYYFRLKALDIGTVGLKPGASRDEVERKIQGHVLGEAVVMGTFAR